MKNNFYFFTTIFTLCLTVNSFGQFIIAGQVSAGDYYCDFIPDTILVANSSNFYLDLDQDNSNDFNFYSYSSGGLGQGFSGVGVTPVNDNQVALSKIASGFNPQCMCFITKAVAKPYALGDTIRNDSSFTNNGQRYLFYYQYLVSYGTVLIVTDWNSLSDKYLGFRIISSIDTAYGWIRMNGSTHMLDYAINNLGAIGIPELNNSMLNKIFVYPNPTPNNFTISVRKELQDALVEIFNSLGDRVYSKYFSGNSTTFDNKLSDGIYFVHVTDGQLTLREKIIVGE